MIQLFNNHIPGKLKLPRGTTFLESTQGRDRPEKKRKIIGKPLSRFLTARLKTRSGRFLAQGTLYPDVIESVPIGGNPAALIKSHHNAAACQKMKLSLLEPLRELFKDEVRALGKTLGLPKEVLMRHPFPGPALACG